MSANKRAGGFNQHKNLVPTLLELAGIETEIPFDGKSLLPLAQGQVASYESEFYITECTWMRKHGWRTPEWKLILALEPDFHFKPPVELYNLVEDPHENYNLAESQPDVVALLTARMEAYIAKREAETGLPNPMLTPGGLARAYRHGAIHFVPAGLRYAAHWRSQSGGQTSGKIA